MRCSCPPCKRRGKRRGCAQCVNNLKQLGLAVHNYVSTNSVLPLQSLYPTAQVDSWGWSYGWGLGLLPGLEQMQTYNAFNFSLGIFGNGNGNTYQQGNNTVMNLKLAVYLCPSDGTLIPPASPYGATNYVGNYGGPGQLALAGTNGAFSGTIVPNAYYTDPNLGPFGFEGITDGTSNTALFSERLLGIASSPTVYVSDINNAKRAIFQATGPGVGTGAAGATAWVAACQGLPGTTTSIRSNGNGYTWFAGYPWHVAVNAYTHVGPPNSTSCNNSIDQGGWLTFTGPLGSAPPNSNHSGGVNMTMTDGSVRFIKNSVSLPTFWAIGTRKGGEVVGSDQY